MTLGTEFVLLRYRLLYIYINTLLAVQVVILYHVEFMTNDPCFTQMHPFNKATELLSLH